MLSNLEFRSLVSRFEFHLPDSQSIYLTSPPVLWSTSSCLLTALAPLGVAFLYIFIFSFSTGSFFSSICLNIFIFLNGRKILFLTLTSSPSLPYLPTLPFYHTLCKLFASIDHLPITPCILDSALIMLL